ncbi:hypothetical protein JJB11_03845 [Ramlibacter ginsenosidimutans]|uniref:Uncharacterized protein n=1 Tax=Ramlibacter ginsenosidimutans TaxID=502333 RepID=A0A934TQB0_9BURK|nr:hypothetical protein [Ramlibacter ginsenosidimutans]MBK6005215.1 hypothetical protein [Ramlibacter ginsenosidimutans]
MSTAYNIDGLDAHQLRELVARPRAHVLHKQTLIDTLTHGNAVLKRLKFAAHPERFTTRSSAACSKKCSRATCKLYRRRSSASLHRTSLRARRTSRKGQPLPGVDLVIDHIAQR